MEEEETPEYCPSCSAPKSQYLAEPWCGDIGKRRIHVDLPEPDPNWNPLDLSFHVPKHFPEHSRHGRVRRFLLQYDDAIQTKNFYHEVFDWDLLTVDDSWREAPVMLAATGPGNPDWMPSVPSFGYGILSKAETDETGHYPRFMVEVSSVDETLPLIVENGGAVLKDKFEAHGHIYAIVEDSEGNAFYLWQTPGNVTWDEPESQTY